jgi:hypothetical protein
LTVTVDVAVPEHDPVVPVTVYVVVVEGVDVTLAPVPLDKVEVGVHVYEVAPVAVNVALWPSQIVGELTFTTGLAFTVTVLVALPEQLPVVPVTV